MDQFFSSIKQIYAMEIWQIEFFNNPAKKYVMAALIFFSFLIIFKIFQLVIIFRLKKLAKKTKTDIDDTAVEIIDSIKPPLYFFLSFWIAVKFLTINVFVGKIIDALLIIGVAYQIIIASQILINYIVTKKFGKEKSAEHTAHILGTIAKGTIWIFGLLFLLQNLGVNVTSLIAGLGIGGIAIALALQNVLGDLFSSLAIYLDRPFTVGDFVIIGNDMGIVEKIGIKTTRIRTLHGEELVVSNNELTTIRINNFKKMNERRVVIELGVTYQTSNEKMKKIPAIIKDIINSSRKLRFDRAHFKKFDNSALTFEIVYYIKSNDYNEHMDELQNLLLQIKESFAKEKISIAYPTQTIYLEKN